jgi:S-formylglutathione hydrolase FrmB
MILLTHNYFSNAIAMATEIKILLPEGKAEKTVFLLSPEGNSGTSWVTSTKAGALCDSEKTAFVIVPSLQGCYTDMVFGYRFFSSLIECIAYLKENLPGVPLEPQKCFAAGVSTGGLAALRLAMEKPDLFAGAASFSGRLDITAAAEGWFTDKRLLCLYGPEENREKLQSEFEQQCSNASEQVFFLFSRSEDPYADSMKKTEEHLKGKAYTVEEPGHSNWKTWSDWLGVYISRIGGSDHVRN